MPMIDALPFPPRADESARGLIVRVAEENLCTATEIITWLGLPPMREPLEADPVDAATKLGMDPEALGAMGFARDSGEVILGHAVPYEMVSRYQMRWCPACLAEAPYHRRIWDHRQIGVCPVHRLRLLHRCPECATENQRGLVAWTRSDMRYCGSGHELSLQPAEAAPGWRGTAAVYRACGLSCDGPDLPAEFANLPLQSLLAVLFFLGRMDVVVVGGNPDRISAAEMVTDPSLLEAGASIAFGWPGTFDHLAARVLNRHAGLPGLSQQYGYLHRFIRRCGGEPHERLLRDAYAAHLLGRDDMSEGAWPEFLPVPPTLRAAASRDQASKILGLGDNAFKRLTQDPLWTNLVTLLPARNGNAQYSRSDLISLSAKLDRLVSPSHLDEALGLGRGRGRKFCDAGLIPVYHWKRNCKGGELRSVDLTDCERLLDGVRGLAQPGSPARPASFSEVLHRAAVRCVLTFADVMRSILSGQLRAFVTKPWKPGFASLSFEMDDVVQVLDELASPAKSGKMCLGDVVQRLRIPGKAVRELIQAGLLPELDRNVGLIFEADAVHQFEERYVLDTELAVERGGTPEDVRAALELVGVRPVAVVALRAKGRTAGVFARQEVG